MQNRQQSAICDTDILTIAYTWISSGIAAPLLSWRRLRAFVLTYVFTWPQWSVW